MRNDASYLVTVYENDPNDDAAIVEKRSVVYGDNIFAVIAELKNDNKLFCVYEIGRCLMDCS